MTVLKVKNEVLKLIGETDNIDVLQEIKIILSKSNEMVCWDDLSVQEQEAIEIGRQDVKEGRLVGDEKVQKKIYGKLNSKKNQ